MLSVLYISCESDKIEVGGQGACDYGLNQGDDARQINDSDTTGFEWWYFDAVLDNGWSLVLVFGYIPPMLYAVRYNLIHTDGDEIIGTILVPKNEVEISTERCDVKFGTSYITSSSDEYKIYVEDKDNKLDLTYKNLARGYLPNDWVSRELGVGFYWLAPQPRAKLSGSIKIGEETIEVRGLGYHDHNWGDLESLLEFLRMWYWGRVHTDNYTMIFADVAYEGGFHLTPFLLTREGELVFCSMDIEFNPKNFTSFSMRDIDYPQTLEIFAEEGGIRVSAVVEARQTLKEMSLLGVFSVVRFKGEAALKINRSGENTSEEGDSIFEVVFPF